MKRILTEPLFHFLLLGAALFFVYSLRSPNPGSHSETIVVTAGQIENLAATFAGVWQRPPTEDELGALIDDYVVEEMLSREAIALKLDRNDIVIRRRLRQKMEFLTEDVSSWAEPTEDELRAFLRDHPESFRLSVRYTFEHIYFSQDRGARARADAVALLEQIRGGRAVNASNRGDRSLLPREMIDARDSEVARQFGEGFAEALESAEVGSWTGPIASGFGAHLVLVRERIPGRTPELDEVREIAEREIAYARREEARERMLDGLHGKYDVIVEPTDGAADLPAAEDPAAP